MDAAARRALVELVGRYGPGLAEDPRRLEGLLRDHCGAHRREIAVLVAAAREGAPRALLDPRASAPVGLRVKRLAQRLEDELALDPAAAVWAVETWAAALGLAVGNANPTETAEPAPPPHDRHEQQTRTNQGPEGVAAPPASSGKPVDAPVEQPREEWPPRRGGRRLLLGGAFSALAMVLTLSTVGFVSARKAPAGGTPPPIAAPPHVVLVAATTAPSTSQPAATPVPPTATAVPPTATKAPPTATKVPPTATKAPPTATRVPPTPTTSPPLPTSTPLPPPPRVTPVPAAPARPAAPALPSGSYIMAGSRPFNFVITQSSCPLVPQGFRVNFVIDFVAQLDRGGRIYAGDPVAVVNVSSGRALGVYTLTLPQFSFHDAITGNGVEVADVVTADFQTERAALAVGYATARGMCAAVAT